MNDRIAVIEDYKRRIGAIETAGTASPPADVWQNLNDIVGKMSAEQLAYVQANPKAIQKKQGLNALFVEWLFERHKNDFVTVAQFEKEARAYVDVITSAASEFSEHNKNLAQENEVLKAEIERLKKAAV